MPRIEGDGIQIIPTMEIHEVGEMKIFFDDEKKEVTISLIDNICDITLTHRVDYESWKILTEID